MVKAARDDGLRVRRVGARVGARAIAGGVLTGVGVAAVVVGAVLRLRADPADRYERPAGWDVAVGPAGASLRGSF